MTIKEKLQLQAETEAANARHIEEWQKDHECMVQISEATLQKVFYLLSERHVGLLCKADKASNPERANKYKTKARELAVLLDDIAAVLDPKE